MVWIRILQKYNKHHIEFKDSWVSVVRKLSIQELKQLVMAVQQFYIIQTSHNQEIQYSPLLIVAKQGTLQQQGDRHHGDLEDEDDLRLPWQPVLETHGDLSRSRLISLDMFVIC